MVTLKEAKSSHFGRFLLQYVSLVCQVAHPEFKRSIEASLPVIRPPGRELSGSPSSRLVLTRSHTQPAKRIKKQFGDSAPTARPQKTGAPVGSRLRFERIALGFTAMSFWTGTRRWIVSLESKLRLGLTTRLRLTRSSSYRCLAGRPSVRAVKRN
jgi:hypothetical protein